MEDGSIAPNPAQIDPYLFYDVRNNRTEFIPRRAANYVIEQLKPLAFSAESFWKYAGGVWKTLPEDEIKSLLTYALKDLIKGKMIEGVVSILKGLLYVPEDQWEPGLNMINVKNGMFNIATMELLAHSPHYRSRVQLPVNYRPGAPVGRWYDFLKSVFPEDYEQDDKGNYIHYLEKHVVAQQFAGYCLLRHCKYQKALFLYGTGSNGKSVFIDTIGAVLGQENTATLSLEELSDPFMTINLHNTLANLSSETDAKAPMKSRIFNKVVSGDELTARHIYKPGIKFRPFCKFIISMNEAPYVTDKSFSFERRLIVLNFTKRFTTEEIIPEMADLLKEEIDGVFNWMVEGLKILLKHNGFVIGANVKEDIEQMMTRVNPFIVFVEDCCITDNPVLQVRTQEMWDAYRDWCIEGGNKPMGRNRFLDQVLSYFPNVKRIKGSDDCRMFKGIGLKYEEIEKIRARLAARPQGKWHKDDD